MNAPMPAVAPTVTPPEGPAVVAVEAAPDVDWDRAGGGGSAAGLSRRAALAVKRGHDAASRDKIDDERRWLEWVAATCDPTLSGSFVPVASADCGPGLLAMPWVDGANARALALRGVVDHELLTHAVHQAAVTLFRTGARPAGRASDLVASWWSQQLRRRVALAQQRHRFLPGLTALPRLRLAGGALPNPTYGGLDAALDALRRHPPTTLGPIHGDLHLGNLLVTPERRALWVDPRCRFGDGHVFDVAYDVAKLLHEPHYVAARAHALRTRLVVDGDELVAVSLRSPGEDDRRLLRPLRDESQALAAYVCRAVGASDPLLAARATLVVGLLFITVLPFDVLVDGEWEAMLVSGLLWVTAGLRALNCGLGLAHCQDVWAALMGEVDHDAAAVASPEVMGSIRAA